MMAIPSVEMRGVFPVPGRWAFGLMPGLSWEPPLAREPKNRDPISSRRDMAHLVVRAREGDGEAFGQLLQSHQPVIWRSLRACGVKGEASAEDLAQETALAAWINLSRLKEPQAFSSWVQAIAANRARCHLRRVAFQQEEAIEEVFGLEAPDDPGRRVELLAESRLMLAALAGEGEDSIRILVARAEGFSAKELAARLGTTPEAVRMRIMRSRSRLRKRLDRLRKGDPAAG